MFHCVHFSWMWCCVLFTIPYIWNEINYISTFYLFFTCVLILFICLIFQKEWREDRHGEFKRKVARCVKKEPRDCLRVIFMLAACSFTIFRVSKWTLPFHLLPSLVTVSSPNLTDWQTTPKHRARKCKEPLLQALRNHPFAECGFILD